MRIIIYFLAIFFLLVIQAGILIPLHLMSVNLLLVFVAVALLVSDFNTGLAITIASGVMLDLVSSTADGLIATALVATFLTVHFLLNSWVNREASQPILFSTVAASTILFFGLFVIFNRVFVIFNLGQILDLKYFLTRQLGWALLFNLIFTYPVFLYSTYVQSLRH